LIRTWKKFAINVFPSSRCTIQEIKFDGRKEKMKIPVEWYLLNTNVYCYRSTNWCVYRRL